tara:strand:+ start:260 stop:1501 length:1242 start_codon:yes stop_codon:yes gene_type:complete
MQPSIWYVSKYITKPSEASHGSRAYYLSEELVKLGYTISIITSDSNNFKEKSKRQKITYLFSKDDGIDFLSIKTLQYKYGKSFKRVLSWLDFEVKLFFAPIYKLKKPEIIIISSLSLLTIINGILLKLKYRSKLIFEIRDIWPLNLTEEGGYKSSNIFVVILKIIELIGYKFSDYIVGTMPNLKEYIRKHNNINKPVSCIPNGYSDAFIQKSQLIFENNNLKMEFKKNIFYIGYFGSFGYTNALETIFKAAKNINHIKDIKFIFFGDGPLKNKFKNKFKNLTNLIFMNPVKREEVMSYASKCDILYFSTKKSKIWNYGQSLQKIIDYMLAGKPIIGSYKGYESMINESSCGEIVEPEDIEKLVNLILKYKKMSQQELKTLGNNGKKWILENRSYSRIAKKYSVIINTLISQKD